VLNYKPKHNLHLVKTFIPQKVYKVTVTEWCDNLHFTASTMHVEFDGHKQKGSQNNTLTTADKKLSYKATETTDTAFWEMHVESSDKNF
jgi:hypothetical protein